MVSPDRYGRFGHQTTSIAAGLFLAHISGSKLVTPRYMYFCEKWNRYADFDKSKHTANTLEQGLNVIYLMTDGSDLYGNRRWNLRDKGQIIELIGRITDLNENSLIHLPFDQSAGLLLHLVNRPDLRDDLRNIFSFPINIMPVKTKYACVHIRRGDCTKSTQPAWYVENTYYIRVIGELLKVLPCHYRVIICTQGDVGWILSKYQTFINEGRLIVRTTSQIMSNNSEVEDFVLMLNAEILFAASSTFSRWASYLGYHKLVVDITRETHKHLRDTLFVNPDLPIDSGLELIKASIVAQSLT